MQTEQIAANALKFPSVDEGGAEAGPEAGSIIPIHSGKSKITELRALLAEKFPQVVPKTGGTLATGLPEVALQRGGLTEISGSPGCSSLFLEKLIRTAQAGSVMMALVDGVGGFDPVGLPAKSRLLWVVCKEARAAIKSADLLLRDGNLSLIVLDLQMNSPKELRGIPATTWYRFQRILEQSTSAFVVITPRPMVSSASERLVLQNRWTLQAMRQSRLQLPLKIEKIQRRILAGEAAGNLHNHHAFPGVDTPPERQIA